MILLTLFYCIFTCLFIHVHDLLVLYYCMYYWCVCAGGWEGGRWSLGLQSVVTVGDHGQRAGYILELLHTEGQRGPECWQIETRGTGPCPIISLL